jgi:hypothetical protein
MTVGCVAAVTVGTRSIPGEFAPHISARGLQRRASRYAVVSAFGVVCDLNETAAHREALNEKARNAAGLAGD